MLKKFLKRFEKLEHNSPDAALKPGLKISKRFERLEIGDKRIEIAITDTIQETEKAPPEVNYFIYCPYCGKENDTKTELCHYCRQGLHTKLTNDYQEKLLKKCVCGTVNQKDRKNCWICGRDFFLQEGKKPEISAQNTITLNINGQEYKSSDENLPFDIRILMEKIRKEGYRKELVDEWQRKKQEETALQQNALEYRIQDIKTQLNWRLIYAAIGITVALFLVMLRSC